VEAPTAKVLELVVFKLHEGVPRDQFLGTNDAVSTWISKQPGFISRELTYDAEGDRWIDILWWETMENAHAAAEQAMTSESCTPMFALIDMESALMLHGTPAIAPVRPATPAAVRQRT
jgi:antibiotic biosynthesis monooxygenase (ABM) superfamily enzyme